MDKPIGVIAGPDDAALLERILADDAAIVRLDFATAEAAIAARALSLLIIAPQGDWWGGLDAIAPVRVASARDPLLVFVLVPRGDMKALAYAFEAAAADCGSYPIDPDEVRIRIRALLRRRANAARLRAEANETRRIANTDPVTGAWNRHYLDVELAAAVSRATSMGLPLALLMIDIDGFKRINDRHGHTVGDRVLRGIAARLAANIRGIDTLARFGGDELAVVMPDIGVAIARPVAERLRAIIADGIADLDSGVTVSIGVADLSRAMTAEALLARADAALYAAKSGGRNRVAQADEAAIAAT